MHDDGVFDEAAAERYDASSAAMFAPEVLGPTVEFLADLAAGERGVGFRLWTWTPGRDGASVL